MDIVFWTINLKSFERTKLTSFTKDIEKNYSFFFTERTKFFTKILKKILLFYLKNKFFRTNCWKPDSFLTERTILMNEIFYWTIEKANAIYGKWTIILRTNKIKFFERLKKTNKMGSVVHDERTAYKQLSKVCFFPVTNTLQEYV